MLRPDLCLRLVELRRRDGETRSRLQRKGKLFEGYAADMERVHRANAQALEAVLDACGWPGISLVGPEGAEAAWLIAQHAISLPRFQQRCLTLLQQAVQRGQAAAAHAAHLDDRIRFNQRKPQ